MVFIARFCCTVILSVTSEVAVEILSVFVDCFWQQNHIINVFPLRVLSHYILFHCICANVLSVLPQETGGV